MARVRGGQAESRIHGLEGADLAATVAAEATHVNYEARDPAPCPSIRVANLLRGFVVCVFMCALCQCVPVKRPLAGSSCTYPWVGGSGEGGGGEVMTAVARPLFHGLPRPPPSARGLVRQ